MPTKTSKALTSIGIIGMMVMMMETLETKSWALLLSHQNFDSTQSAEEYAMSTATPAMRRWFGGRDAKVALTQTITLTNEKFEATIDDDKRNWMWDKTGLLNTIVSRFVGRSLTHWNKLCSEAIELGETALTYDGATFFSASHSFGASGTLKNLVTKTTVPQLQVVSTTAVTVAEMANAIYGCINQFRTFKDDEGEPLNEDAMHFLVMVPTALSASAQQAVANKTVANSTSVIDNPLGNANFKIDIAVNPRLTSSTVFYVFVVDGEGPAFILQQRGVVEYSKKAEGSDYEHDTGRWQFGMNAERTVGLYCWQSAMKATVST